MGTIPSSVLVLLLCSALHSALCRNVKFHSMEIPILADEASSVSGREKRSADLVTAEVVCSPEEEGGLECVKLKKIQSELEACRQEKSNLTLKIISLEARIKELLRNTSTDEEVDKEFEDWKKAFGKSYKTPEEEATRKEIWLKTRDMVNEHNKKYEQGLVTWTMGLNHFADLHPHELPHGINLERP